MRTSIEVSEEEGVRYLHFGSRWIQGAMRIARPYALELEYTRDMMMPLLLRRGDGWPRTVLQIGLGAASITRFLHRNRPRAAQTVIEIEPRVIAAAVQSFKLPPEDARLRIEVADGTDFMAASARQFDLILIDGYDAGGRTGALDTLPFYCNCAARLSARGVFAANLLTRNHGARASLERIAAAFGGRSAALPTCASGNVVALGAAGELIEESFVDITRAAARLKRDTALNLVPTVARWQEAHGGRDALVTL